MLPIIPYPSHAEVLDGSFLMEGQIEVHCTPELTVEAGFFCDRLNTLDGVKAVLLVGGDQRTVSLDIDPGIPAEGYELTVSQSSISVKGGTPAGVFYGIQTCVNAFNPMPTGAELPCLRIIDAPRFPWRGLHLDVGRHMFAVADVKQFLDLMAGLKLNRFHWHLTEDQGWRIEIDSYPELTTIGSRRSGPNGDYEGFYTKNEVREVVAYAKERHIEVVPEIEMPGHTQAVLAAYPGLACTDGPFTVMDSWGISSEVFCAGNDSVFDFLYRVLDEVVELFPYEYVHIGGDECPKDRWSECERCQKRIADEGLADEHELQSWFIKRVEQYLLAKGRSIIGWDEILEGGLAPHAAVMSWRGIEGGIAAARAGHPVVMSPTEYCYFDYPQSDAPDEPGPRHFTTPVLTTEKVYSFEPVPDELNDTERRHVLGAQGNLWTECIETPELLQYMTFPRACALAEVVWSQSAERNWEGFTKRLPRQLARYREMGVNVCDDPAKWE